MTIFVNNSFAQDESMNPTRKGRFITDVDFGLSFANSDLLIEGQTNKNNTKIRTVEVDIEFGYNVIDNLSIGIGVDVETQHSEIDVAADPNGAYPAFTILEDQKTSTYFLYGNYYFLKDKFKPFIGLNAGYSKFSTEDTDGLNPAGDNSIEGSGLDYGARVGFVYFLNDHIGLNLMYKIHFSSLDNKNTLSTFRFNSSSDYSESNILAGITVAF